MSRCFACGYENPWGIRYCHGCGEGTGFGDGFSSRGDPSSVADEDTFVEGRYRKRRLLGEGARKRVLQVWDTLLERDVAFALMKTEGWGFWKPYPMGFDQLKKEAQLLAKLGDHPHIVPVHDLGEDRGLPYMVMQLMTGGDLEQHLLRMAGGPADLEWAVATAGQIAAALSYAHHLGVVHRDLKPGNVWLSESRGVKVGDFGLAMADEGRLSVSGVNLAGTIAYMPPEQVLGKDVDGRADLYSLGVVLYELVTGQVPFPGNDAVTVIGQHVSEAPVAPVWLNPELPPELDDLILQLLAKDPADRPADAQTIESLLTDIGRKLARSRRGPMSVVQANPVNGLALEGFVGRETELAAMRSAFEAASESEGGVLLISGEAGIGKTRLARELETYARTRGARVLWGTCPDGGGAPVYWPWLEALGSLVRKADPDEAEDLVLHCPEEMLRLMPLPPRAKGRIQSAADEPTSPASPEEASLARFRIFGGVRAMLERASADTPLVLVLDDLHWVDGASLALLTFLLPRMRDIPVLVVGIYREHETREKDDFSRLLTQAAKCHGVHILRVSPLALDEVERFIRVATGRAPSNDAVRLAFDETDGNPFFVKEFLRWQATRGLEPTRPDSGSMLERSEIREVLRRRVQSVPADCVSLLEAATVAGRRFSLNTLEALVDRPRDEVLELLARAVRAGLLTGEGPTLFRFSHCLVREALHTEMDPRRRAALHGRAGDLLVAKAESVEDVAAEAAVHYTEAAATGTAGRAVDLHLRAAAGARRSYAWEDAVRHLHSAAELGQDYGNATGIEAAPILEELGDVQALLSRLEAAEESYRNAVRSAKSKLAGARLLRKVADMQASQRRVTGARWTLEEAEATLGTPDERDLAGWEEWIQIRLTRAWCEYYAGRGDELADVLAALRPVIGDKASLRQQAEFHACSVIECYRRTRYSVDEETMGHLRAQAEILQTLGSEMDLCTAESQLGFGLLWKGKLEEAEKHLLEGLYLSQRSGDARFEQQNLSGLCVVCRRRGEYERLKHFTDRLEAAAEAGGTPEFLPMIDVAKCWLAQLAGKPAHVRRHASNALGLWAERSMFPFEWLVRFPLLEDALARRDDREALRQCEAMIRPSQQVLPREVETSIKVVSALYREKGGGEQLRQALEEVIAMARKHQHL